MHKAFSLAATLAMLIGTAACSDPPPVFVDGGYVRLNPNPQAPSAAYFSIHAGKEPVTLRMVTTDEAVRLEIHESMMGGNMASMKPIDTIDVPAGETVKLAPGGKHIMLWTINPQALADGKMSFTFTFSNGQRILADAVVQKTDGSAAGGATNEHMGH